MEGANPCKKDAGGLREPTKTLQIFIPWHEKSKSSRKVPLDHGAIAEDCKDVSADTTDVLSADTSLQSGKALRCVALRCDALRDTTHVLPADKFGVGNPAFTNYF